MATCQSKMAGAHSSRDCNQASPIITAAHLAFLNSKRSVTTSTKLQLALVFLELERDTNYTQLGSRTTACDEFKYDALSRME
ncbi:hypothetical protein DNTS_031731 [Danionella cerebrum]|uniref:Uncharacterized protein n=1 Tax=Danionella cerebrum TaxID=2873325 RepID=A0A553QB91_9TELE|nr:hypothetical protein DNTS_031731 [Danionella translucida]